MYLCLPECKFYRTAISWAIKRYHAQKMSVAEMRMLRWMCGNTRRDYVRNEDICTKIGVSPIEEKMIEKIAYDGLIMCDVDLQMRQSGV